MYAVKYNGTIYISHVEEVRPAPKGEDIREPKLRCLTREEEVGKISYMGKQFEKVISEAQTQDTSSANGNRGITVDERQGFYSVSVGTFGGRHRLLTRSEVDAIENVRNNTVKLRVFKNLKFHFKHPSYKNHFRLKFQSRFVI